jgi:hypothetical protein
MQALSKSLRGIRVHDSHAQRLGSKKQKARLSCVATDSDTTLHWIDVELRDFFKAGAAILICRVLLGRMQSTGGNTTKLAAEYLISRDAIYRHAHALGLMEKRRRNLRAALEKIIEEAGEVEVNADLLRFVQSVQQARKAAA